MRATPQKRHRMRSSSVSLHVAGRSERGEKMGVLQTVQVHARGRHAFTVETLASAKERLLADPTTHVDPSQPPLLVRRNSTSAPLSPLLTPADAQMPTPPPEPLTKQEKTKSKTVSAKQEEVITDPAAPQTVTPPPTPKGDHVHAFYLRRLQELVSSRSPKQTTDFIRKMLLDDRITLTAEHFNLALDALIFNRQPGEPLNAIIRVYNAMLEKSVSPNVQTYEKLIQALTTRDWELHRAIVALESRVKHVPLCRRDEVASLDEDRARIETLKKEDNFSSALSLFEGILAIGGRDQLDLSTFNRLLRSCSFHSNVDAAIHVFGQLESAKDINPNHAVYQNMILTFSNAGRVDDSEMIFQAFRKASQEGRLGQFKGPSADSLRQRHIQVWNAMIEAYFRADMADQAVELVDQMVHSTAGNSFAVHEVPVTTSSTFSTVIAGFVLNGDINSALAWFDKLLAQPKAPINPFQGLDGTAMRPDSIAWHMMLDGLALHGKVDDLNRLFKHLKAVHIEDHITIRPMDYLILVRANLEHLNKLDRTVALETLTFLVNTIQRVPEIGQWKLEEDIAMAYADLAEYTIACDIISDLTVRRLEHNAKQTDRPSTHFLFEIQTIVLRFTDALYRNLKAGNGALTFPTALSVVRLMSISGLRPELRFAPYFVHTYAVARHEGRIQWNEVFAQDWDVLLRSAAYLESNAIKGNPDGLPTTIEEAGRLTSVLQDLAQQQEEITFSHFDADVKTEVLEVLEAQYGQQGRADFITTLGPSFVEESQKFDQLRFAAVEDALTREPEPLLQAAQEMEAPAHDYSNLTINPVLTRHIEELVRMPGKDSKGDKKLMKAYHAFEKNLNMRKVPDISAVCTLIQALGRINDLDKVRELYTVAQHVIPLTAQSAQHRSWCNVEDAMIIALAHAGHPDAAHVHRVRILDQGAVPSADAYGVLIQYVRDTTDDTNGGMALFQEALERGVKPNMYLYNNIISKLSKARKADYALELFQQMKASSIPPSSITYGAVIGACARVGDVRSAEVLFHEMTHSKNFRPRVPPYNTMMQLHTTTKPSRDSALYYYSELRAAGIKPSAHTYKVRDFATIVQSRLLNHVVSFFSTHTVLLSLSILNRCNVFSMNYRTTRLSNSLATISRHSSTRTAALARTSTRLYPSLNLCPLYLERPPPTPLFSRQSST